jgi:hypothetical protein
VPEKHILIDCGVFGQALIIQAPTGKLAILTSGMGAVFATFIARIIILEKGFKTNSFICPNGCHSDGKKCRRP